MPWNSGRRSPASLPLSAEQKGNRDIIIGDLNVGRTMFTAVEGPERELLLVHAALFEANKSVDDAANALQSHNATRPVAGKEAEYKAETTKLETALATAKAERDALLQLMQRTANSASQAFGKISQLQAGGGLSAAPNVEILHDMQEGFLRTDIGRDIAHACMVELGLRNDTSTGDSLKTLTEHLEKFFKKDPNKDTGTNYAGAINLGRHTLLTVFCNKNLLGLVSDAAKLSHEYRIYRARLGAETATARYSADAAKASAKDRKLFIDSINLCKSAFKDDADRQKACLDQVVPIKAGQQGGEAAKPPAGGEKAPLTSIKPPASSASRP